MMDIVDLNEGNLGREHICCAISSEKDCQVAAKKAWLAGRFADGLVFKKCDVRGKCFIEYIPAEKAWCPVDAEGYMHIDCFWVSGQFAGHGYANLLMDECVKDSKAKGKRGLCVVSAKKKMPFLSDPGYLKHKGFVACDTADPFFELLYLPFEAGAPAPRFLPCVKGPAAGEGFVLYYSHQCPFTAKYVPIIEEAARARSVPFRAVRFETAEDARNAPAPSTLYSLFFDGKFLTNEILSEKKFFKILEAM